MSAAGDLGREVAGAGMGDRDRAVLRRAAAARPACRRGSSGRRRSRRGRTGCPARRAAASGSRAACRRRGPGSPEARRPALSGCSPSTSLAGSIAATTASESRCAGQRQLHEDAVDGVVGIELGDELHQLLLASASSGRTCSKLDHPDLARGLALVAHVDAARRVVADEDDREARRRARRPGQRRDRGGDPLAEAGGDGLAVDDAGTHAGFLADSCICGWHGWPSFIATFLLRKEPFTGGRENAASRGGMRHFRATGQDVCVKGELTLRHPFGAFPQDRRRWSEERRTAGSGPARSRSGRSGCDRARRACRWASSSPGASRSAPSRTSSMSCGSPPTRATGRGPSSATGRSSPTRWTRCPPAAAFTVQPGERLGDPARFDYIVVVGGLLEEIPNISPAYTRFLQRAAEAGRAARRPLHRRLRPAPRRADARLPRLRQLVLPRRLPRAVRRPRAGLRPDLRRRRRPPDLRRRRQLRPSRGLSRGEARRPRAGEQEPAHHDHRRRAAAGEGRSPASRWN